MSLQTNFLSPCLSAGFPTKQNRSGSTVCVCVCVCVCVLINFFFGLTSVEQGTSEIW